jgi:hypothetical protein
MLQLNLLVHRRSPVVLVKSLGIATARAIGGTLADRRMATVASASSVRTQVSVDVG